MSSPSGPSNHGATVQTGARPATVAGIYLLIGLAFAALGWSGLWDMFSLLSERISPWWSLATALPACAVVLVKRRAPFAGLAVSVLLFAADLVTVGGLVPLLVMLELIHACVIALPPERRRRMLWAVCVGALALVAAAYAASGDPRVVLMAGLQFGGMLGLTFWYANSVAQSRELVELHLRRAEDAERMAGLDRAAAVQGERDRMARELHDAVAGSIAAVAIRSEAALGMPGEESSERSALRAVRDASLEAHAALRSMIGVLRSGEREFALPPGRERIPELVEAATASGVRARLVDAVEGELPAPIDQAIGRIVQESLANAVRHASGSEVEVRLAEQAGAVRVSVLSRGGEALPQPELRGSGMGLELLAERARALGGAMTAGPEPDGAWAVRVELPRGSAS